jgi:phosphohistidine phosphatase
MPQLLMLRHGKSDWDADFALDRDRPLAKRGRKAAGAIGRALTRMDQVPDLILTSPALRARSTAELAAEAGGWDVAIEELEALYGASAEVILGALTATPEESRRLMIVGHEPVWSELVSLLIGGGRLRMVTGAVAAVDVPRWDLIGPAAGQLRWMLAPRLFTDGDLEI